MDRKTSPPLARASSLAGFPTAPRLAIAICLAFATCLPFALWAPAARAEAPPPPAEDPAAWTVQDLAFLTGCWEGTLPSGQLYRESYSAPAGAMILGRGQLLASAAPDARTLFFEFSRIQETEAGLVYVPYPAGRESVPFPLARLELTGATSRAVFENPDHDFPQRIVYERTASEPTPDRLLARAEGGEGADRRVDELPMAAVACPP